MILLCDHTATIFGFYKPFRNLHYNFTTLGQQETPLEQMQLAAVTSVFSLIPERGVCTPPPPLQPQPTGFRNPH